MVKSNKSKKQKQKQRNNKNINQSKANFSGTGIEAPLALDTSRPIIGQSFKGPTHKGSEGRVTGVDFVGTYSSSNSTYSINTFNINARNTTLFPRLSEIAGVWRRYFFRKLKFHIFGINAATQRGYLAMSSLITDDLSTLVSPTTEAQILNQENVAIGRPWSYVCHTVNLGGLGLKWYTTDTATSSSEFGEYIGRSFLGIPQTTEASDIQAQVYVEYDVEFCQRIAGTLVSTLQQEVLGGTFLRVSGGGSSNVFLNNTPDPQLRGITANSGVFTFNEACDYIFYMYMQYTGTAPGVLTVSGANVTDDVIQTSEAAYLGRFSISSQGGSIGPFVLAGASTISYAYVTFGTAPPNSVATGRYDEVSHVSALPRIRCVQK